MCVILNKIFDLSIQLHICLFKCNYILFFYFLLIKIQFLPNYIHMIFAIKFVMLLIIVKNE